MEKILISKELYKEINDYFHINSDELPETVKEIFLREKTVPDYILKDVLSSRRNPFVALCELASKENWCWYMPCGTCGHQDFRYGFAELLRGKHPDQSIWIVKNDSGYFHQIDQPPSIYGDWDLTDMDMLSKIISSAPIEEIMEVAKFPDWLGHLGLGLMVTEKIELKNRRITKSLVPQFLKVVKPNYYGRKMLEQLIESDTLILKWQNLETIELSFERSLIDPADAMKHLRYESDWE